MERKTFITTIFWSIVHGPHNLTKKRVYFFSWGSSSSGNTPHWSYVLANMIYDVPPKKRNLKKTFKKSYRKKCYSKRNQHCRVMQHLNMQHFTYYCVYNKMQYTPVHVKLLSLPSIGTENHFTFLHSTWLDFVSGIFFYICFSTWCV